MERLRDILIKHLNKLNPKFTLGQIDSLEADIRTFVKFTLHSAKELGLAVECEGFIGDFDAGSKNV